MASNLTIFGLSWKLTPRLLPSWPMESDPQLYGCPHSSRAIECWTPHAIDVREQFFTKSTWPGNKDFFDESEGNRNGSKLLSHSANRVQSHLPLHKINKTNNTKSTIITNTIIKNIPDTCFAPSRGTSWSWLFKPRLNFY